MKHAIMRALAWLALRCGLYYWWSRVYRRIWERGYRDVKLPEFASVKELSTTVGAMTWRKDLWRELWDAISDPRAAWDRHEAGKAVGDCDDISIFAADRIEDMRSRGLLRGVTEVGLLSCPWMDWDDKVGGHNVCVFRYILETGERHTKMRWGHVSNWYGGEVREGYKTLEDVVRFVVKAGGGKEARSIGWGYASVGLRLREYGSGKGLV